MSPNEMAKHIVERILSHDLQKLRDAGNVSTPSDELAIVAIEGCLNSRTLQWRKTSPKEQNAECLWKLVKFHTGSGNLWGYPWFVGVTEDEKEQLDTLAIVLNGNKSQAADAWTKAIYGK